MEMSNIKKNSREHIYMALFSFINFSINVTEGCEGVKTIIIWKLEEMYVLTWSTSVYCINSLLIKQAINCKSDKLGGINSRQKYTQIMWSQKYFRHS